MCWDALMTHRGMRSHRCKYGMHLLALVKLETCACLSVELCHCHLQFNPCACALLACCWLMQHVMCRVVLLVCCCAYTQSFMVTMLRNLGFEVKAITAHDNG